MQTTLNAKSRKCHSSNETLSSEPDISHKLTRENIISSLNENIVYIPISITKNPVCDWKYIDRTPTHLFKEGHNVAILTGKINKMTIIDFDLPKKKEDQHGMKKYDELMKINNKGQHLNTPICRTQSGGIHLYFNYDKEINTSVRVNGYSIDVRNDRGLIICPPSIGAKGPYTWIDNKSIKNTELMNIPKWLKDWLFLDTKKFPQGGMLKAEKQKKEPKNKKTKTKIPNVEINNPSEKTDKYIKPKKDIVYIYEESDIVDLLNNLPQKYVNSYSDWLIITTCLKSEGLKKIWDDWSKKSTSYDSINNEKIWNSLKSSLDIMYLCVIARIEKLDGYCSIIQSTKQIEYIMSKPNSTFKEECISNQILKDFLNLTSEEVNLLLKSPCGSGKTKFACRNIKTIMETSDKKLLSISVRISMAYQQLSDFKEEKLDVKIYKDLKQDELNKQNKLIIQIDSIFKLDLCDWHGAILYLDEISALLSYILTSTTLTKRNRILCTFINLVKNASQIICTDADLNDIVLTFFKKLNIKYSFIQNDYKSEKKKNAYEYENKNTLIKILEQELLENKPFFACFDTKAEMDVTVERLKKFCEENKLTKQLNNFLCYSSEEGDANDFLVLNEKWRSKFVFYSPKITIGLSFVNRTPRKVFLFSMGFSINASQLIQQMSRCRNVSEVHYFIVKKYNKLLYHCPEDVKAHYADLIRNFTPGSEKYVIDNVHTTGFHSVSSELFNLNNIIDNGYADFNPSTAEFELRDHVFNDMFYIHEYYDNVLRSAQREQFRWMLEDKNFVIVNVNEPIDEKEEISEKENTKIAKKKVKEKKQDAKKRSIYNKESSLTLEEKVTLNKAKNRATYLGINFNKKVEKKGHEDLLINDNHFTQCYSYRLLKNEKFDIKTNKNCCANITKKTLTKIGLIKKLEDILGVNTLDIDTQRDSGRFDEDVNISDVDKAAIKKEFRIRKQNQNDKYKFWYYELIQMYKNILGEDIMNVKRTQKNKIRCVEYITNNDVLKEKFLN